MNQPLQDVSNAREDIQRRIMEELAHTGECFLCPEVIQRIATKYSGIATLPLHEGAHWFIKENDFPYAGTRLHMLIAPKRHAVKMEDLTAGEFLELQHMISWVNKTYDIQGAALFVRYGDMSYTGATLAHMHFHILHGVAKHDGCEAIRPKLGYK